MSEREPTDEEYAAAWYEGVDQTDGNRQKNTLFTRKFDISSFVSKKGRRTQEVTLLRVDRGATFVVRNGEIQSRKNRGRPFIQADQLAKEQLTHLPPEEQTTDALWSLITALLGDRRNGTIGNSKSR